jgi:hypothetical protein
MASRSVSPTGDATLHALALALLPFLRPLLSDSPSRPYSQRDGERPAGCGRIKFLRAWRRAADAGDAGAWSEGRARLMSSECWTKWSRTSRVRVTKAPPAAESGPSLLESFGLKREAS